jgi:hypothetical protein
MTTAEDRLLLADLSIGKIRATCNQSVQWPSGALCYNNLTQHHYDFII